MFALRFEVSFQLDRAVKIILERRFPFGRNEDEIGNTCLASLIDRVLDQWTIHESHNLFRDRFGCGQKPRSETSNRENRFGYFSAHVVLQLTWLNFLTAAAYHNKNAVHIALFTISNSIDTLGTFQPNATEICL